MWGAALICENRSRRRRPRHRLPVPEQHQPMIERAGREAPAAAVATLPCRTEREVEAAGERQARPPAGGGRWRPGKLLVGGLVIALAVGYLAVTGLRNASVYYVTPSELEAKGATAFDRTVR